MSTDFRNLKGTSEDDFRVGLSGFTLRNNSGVAEIRDEDGSALQILRGKDPVGDTDLATKSFVESVVQSLIVDRQADTSSSLPTNTLTAGFVVVTTAGSGASIGDILIDDGSGTGDMEILSAKDGREIFIDVALSGGSITFDPQAKYRWVSSSLSWKKVADIGSVAGAIREIQLTLDTSATKDTSTVIAASSYIKHVEVRITTPYDAGSNLQVGISSDPDLFLSVGEVDVETVGNYVESRNTSIGGSDSSIRVTIGGSPAAGAGLLIIRFVQPLG